MPRVRPAYPVASLVAYAVLLTLVAVRWSPLARFDTAVSARARAVGTAHAGWVGTLRVLTDAGATPVFLAVGIALTVLLALRRRYAPAVCLAMVTATVPVCWELGHLLLHRPRPADAFVAVAGNGFPSGHTANATALALVAVLLLWPGTRRAGRVALVTAAALVTGFVAMSRVALLAHWPSDVVGGVLLAAGLVPLCAFAARRETTRRERTRRERTRREATRRGTD